MKRIFNFLCFLFFIINISSCIEGNICDDIGDLRTYTSFSIVDRSTSQDLIAKKEIYNITDIDLTINGVSIISDFELFGDISAEFGINTSLDLTIHNDDYYLLTLSSTETDSLQIQASLDNDECTGEPFSYIEYMIYQNDTIFNNRVLLRLKK